MEELLKEIHAEVDQIRAEKNLPAIDWDKLKHHSSKNRKPTDIGVLLDKYFKESL